MNARIALLPGDGVGPEVTAAARLVLEHVATVFGHQFTFDSRPIGGAALRRGSAPLPDDTVAACLQADAILLGAVGDAQFDSLPANRRPEAALLQLRQRLGLYANLRPARVWPGLENVGPLKPEVLAHTDLLVVRELTGGLYYGEPRGISTRRRGGLEHAALLARRGRADRPRRRSRRRGCASATSPRSTRPTCSRPHASGATSSTDVAKDYPDVTAGSHVCRLVRDGLTHAPASFDVIVTENMFGDILSDEAGAIVGSLGLLPSASLGDGTGLFEPVHGTAPDIAGLDVANPVGAILSAAMLLRHALSLEAEATAVEAAVGAAIGVPRRTRDIGGIASCSAVAQAVVEQVRRP